jgi:hypothetical protein
MRNDVVHYLGGRRGERVGADKPGLRVIDIGSRHPVDVAALHGNIDVHHAVGADGDASGRQIDLVG